MKLHEETLNLLYGHYNSRFEKQHLFTIHHQNMHCLRVKISVMLRSKHFKHSSLGQLDAELVFVVSA